MSACLRFKASISNFLMLEDNGMNGENGSIALKEYALPVPVQWLNQTYVAVIAGYGDYICCSNQ